MSNNLFAQITALVASINKDVLALTEKRAQLRALTKEWSASIGAETITRAPASPKKAKAKKKDPGVNVAAAVRALVQRQTGLTAAEIMDKLGLRDHEQAVRSALKKEKGATLINVDRKWYPIAKDPEYREPQKENPATVQDRRVADALNGPGGYEAMIPG